MNERTCLYESFAIAIHAETCRLNRVAMRDEGQSKKYHECWLLFLFRKKCVLFDFHGSNGILFDDIFIKLSAICIMSFCSLKYLSIIKTMRDEWSTILIIHVYLVVVFFSCRNFEDCQFIHPPIPDEYSLFSGTWTGSSTLFEHLGCANGETFLGRWNFIGRLSIGNAFCFDFFFNRFFFFWTFR